MTDVAGWVATYKSLVTVLDPSTFVATHGEPGLHNQWITDGQLKLIDWESLSLAPRERDLRSFDPIPANSDPALLELFDLEWRLSEILAFSEWLRDPHTGNDDDAIALDALRDELTRPAARSAQPH